MRRFPNKLFMQMCVLCVIGFVLVAGCKPKHNASSKYEPPKRTASLLEDYSSLCSGGDAFEGAPAYEKKNDATKPSKVAVFRKYVDDAKPTWALDEGDFGASLAKAGETRSVEVVACVELKRNAKSNSCSYYGAAVDHYDMTHTIKIVEAKTGKVLKEDKFDLDGRTEKCDASVTRSAFSGTDFRPRLLSLLLPFEPDGVELPKITPARLDEVCSGSMFPQAPIAPPTGAKGVHLVYFPFAERSNTQVDPPDGLTFPNPEADVAKTPLVACITGVAKKKRATCPFYGGGELELSDGEFDVVVKEARTGKVVDTKSFKGTSGGCPDSWKLYGKVDKVMTKAEPALTAYLKALAG